MDAFSMFGIFALCLAAVLFGRVRRLEQKLRRVERKQKGGNEMSALFQQLEGSRCRLRQTNGVQLPGECRILAADEEWVKISITDKKGQETVKLLRMEDIAEVTCL